MLPILRKLRPARRQLHRAPRIYKPQLEILEDRRLLSGFTDLFVVNSDSNSIARFDASGTPTFVTASGGGPAFIIFDSDGDFLVSSPALGTVHEYSPTGTDLGNFVQNVPGASGLAFDPNGNLYVSSNSNNQIREFSPTGADLGVFGSVLDSLSIGLAFDSQGNLYAAEHNFNDIRKFSPTGVDLGVFASAGLDAPFDLKFDQQGNLYVACLHLGTIHEYSPTGADLGIFATGPFAEIGGLVFDASGNLYAGSGQGLNIIRKFSPTGADLGNFASTGLSNPVGLAFAPHTVTAGVLQATVNQISAMESAAFTGTVASFTDTDGDPASNYTATIDWGDGNPADTGTIQDNGDGTFSVLASHTYAEEGTYAVSVTISDADGTSATTGSTATIDDAVLAATGMAVSATEGAEFSGIVASFTDADANGMNSDYTATIDWGDGNISNGFITGNDSGGFDVYGTNTFAEEGAYAISVSIADVGGSTASMGSTASVGDAALLATGPSVSTTEGAEFSGVVASFTDNNPNATPGDFTASIDWGDGNVSSGTVSANANGGFDVAGTNTYLEEGTYAISVVITDFGGSTATTGSTASVDDAALAATGLTVNAAEGTEFSGVVASFTDNDPNAINTDFTATIHWGDGNVSDGFIAANDQGGFDVNGTNIYTEEGTYAISVSITDVGGNAASASSTVMVMDAALSATGIAVGSTEGTSFTGAVATFTDANPSSDINDLSATITWGDGHSSAGTIMANGPNSYTVSGTNAYAEEGSYSISVQIRDQGGSIAATSSTANVADAPLTAMFKKFAPIEGARFTGVVATFRDTDPNAALSDYSATIIWGDGHISAGKITPTTGGGFNVTGSTTYTEEGTYAISVTIQDVGGSTATAGGSIKIVDAALSVVLTYAVAATAGPPVTARLLTFRDADPNGVVADYTASIDWGDGHKSSGTITVNGTGGFDVTGTNSYLRPGTYTIKVLIADAGGSNVSSRTTAMVGAAMATILSPLPTSAEGMILFRPIQQVTDLAGQTKFSSNSHRAQQLNSASPRLSSSPVSGSLTAMMKYADSVWQNEELSTVISSLISDGLDLGVLASTLTGSK